MKKAMKAMVALLGAFVSLTVSSAWAAEPLTENITLMASETVEVTSGEAVALKWVAKPDELAGERLDVKVERQVDSSAKVTITANGTAAAAKPAVIALYGDNELVKTISVTITDKVDKNYMAENKTNGIERLVVNVKDARVIHVGETWEYTTATKGNGTWTISNHTDTYKSYNLSNFDSYFTIGGTTSTDNTSRNLKKNEDGTTTFSITGKDSAGDKALVFSIKDGNTEVMRVQVIVDGKYEDVKIKRGETVRKSGVYNSTGNDRRWAFDNDGSDANVVALAMKYGETSAVNTPLDECPYKSGFYQTKNWNQEFNADLTGKNLGSQLIRVARVNNSESSFSTMYQYNVFVYDEATDSIDCKAGDVITDKAFTSEKAGAWEATSSDPTVVTVTEAGWTDTSFTPVIKALKEGKATLTVKNNFITYTVTVNVAKGKEIKNISIEKDGEAYVDDTIAGGASASSDDEGVATITLNSATKATIAGVAAGDAVCTVKDSASNPIYEYNVKVYETKTADALVATGKTATVSLMSAKPAVWTAKAYDETVVQVLTPSSGEATDAFSLLLKGLDVGSTTVSVENDYVKYAVTVTVSGDVKKMDLAVETGKTVTTNLTFASAVYWVATPASDDDADVMTVSVDEERKSAAMTATIETLKPGLSQWTVYVKESENGELVPAYAMSVKVWKAAEFSISLQPEESVTTNLTSAAQDSWTAESSAPAVATVTATGASSTEFAPTITALADGETTITAKNGYAVYTIHVKVRTIIPVSVPTAEDLTYTGLEQTGVIASKGYTLTGNVGTNAGNYTATAKLVDGYCWDDKSTTDKTIDWSIAKKPVTVTGDSTSKVYGAADPTLTATVVGTNGFDGAEIAYTIAREEGNDVGTYDIVVTVDDADQGNYTVSGGTAADAFEITRAPIARPAAKTDLVYNGGCQTGVVAAAGFAVADNAATNAGTYTATATLDGNHMWTGGSTDAADVNFTIAPAEIEVKADNKTVKLDASVPDYTYTVSPALFGDDKLEGSLACAYDPNSGTNKVGMVFDILQGTLTNANYTITSFTKGTLTIASLQVELEPAGRTYDGTAFPSNSITFKVTDNDGNTITDFSVAGTNSMFDAGTYTFKVTTADGLEGSADFVVSQALVKVTAASTNKVYSGSKATDPEFMATVEGLVNGEGEDLIEYTLARVEGENVGEYAITPSGDASQGNYKIEFVSATFTIFPKDVTVTANSATKTYGDNDPEFTATVVGTNGTDGVTIQYKFTRDEGDVATNATPYVIRPVSVNVYCTGNVETQRNYVVTYDWSDSARLTIDRKSVTVTIASTNLVYGDVYPDWESSVDNLPYGDKLDYTLAPLNCNGDASETAYVIAPVSYNTNGNYIVNFVNGELTIERRPILVTVVATNKVYSGDAATDPTFTYVVSNAEGTAELKVLPNGTDVVLNGWLVRTAGEDVKDSPYDVDTLTYFNETNNPNYLFEEKLDGEDKFTILPAAVLVQADDKSKLFGWDDPEWTATVTGTNGTDGVKIDYTVKCDHGEAVGKYPIVVSGKTPQGGLNYDITCSNGWFEICAGKMSVTTNGVTRGYDDIDAAFAALLEKGGKAFFNADVTFGGSTFAKGSTLTVAEDGSWTTDGTLTLAEDICVGTVVAASNVVLTTDVTVGVTEEVTNELAVLTFKEIDLGENHLTLTTNGVVRSAKQLVIDDVFVEPSKAYEVIEKKITDGWEYTAVLHGFTITFNSNGGSPVDDIVAAAGETVEGPEENPTRTGYGFDGWYTNGVMKVEFPLTMPMADFTLDAHWTANDYKVAYDPNGGEGSATTNDATYDVAFKVADCTFAKEGYTFAGWTTNLASAVRFQPGDSVSNLTVTAGATVTMYAAWTANVYAVTYDPNGGSGEAATSNETYDVDFTVAGQPFTKEGHTYNSWTNAEGDVFLVGAVTNNLSTGEAVTLYAKWNPITYRLVYTANGGEGENVERELTYDVAHKVIANPFTRKGYGFSGWIDGEGAAVTNQPGAFVKNLTNEQGAVVTWLAAWTAGLYTLTFDSNGGSEVDPIVAKAGKAISAPEDPMRAWYDFAGWTTNGVEVALFPTTMPGEDLTFVAQWTPAPGNPENPWSVGPDGSDAVEAYVEPDLGRVVIRLNETNEIDLVALTNALAQVREVEIVLDSFNAVIEIDEGAYMTPASWSDTRDVKDPYPTLGDALMGGTQFVSPNLSAEEPPAEIIEKSEVEVEGGKVVVAATVENDSANVESNAIQAVAVEGLVGIAEEKKTDVTLTVTAKTKDDVGEDSVLALDAVNTNGVGGVSSFETGYVDLSVYCGGSAEPEKRLGSLLAIHVARTIAPQCLYRVSRIHDGVAEAIPEYPQTNGDGEFFRVDALAGEIVFCVMNFSIYSVAEIETSAETDTYITVDDANGVREGTNIVVRVTGGRSAFSASAQLQVVYGSATASDLDLKNVKVNGALVSGFKFPYTLTWVNGEVWEQVIEIPVKVQSRARQNRDLTFALANPMNASLKGVDDPVANWSYRKVTILGASGPVSGKFCVRATPNDATRGKTSGSALVVPGKKVTVKATAQKDYVFTGWFEGEELKERAASYAFTPTADVDLVARFEPLAADFLELKDDFLPAEIELGKVFSNAVTVASGSLPTISVSGLPAGLKYYAKETVVRDTKAKTEYTVPANTIYGIPTKASATNKTTKAVTPSKVKVTVKNLGGYKIARTYELRVTARTAGLAAVVKDDVPFFAVSAALSDDAAGKVTGAKLYQAGKKVTLKATANKGYVFAGWYDTVPSASSPTDAGQLPRSTSASYAFTMPPSNVTLVAKFALPGEIPDPTGKNPWGVAVVRNNDFAGNVTGAGYYQVGKKVTLKATALKGYVFSGWYRDAAFEDRITQDASYVIAQMPAENVRCYARFVTAGEDLASIVTAANGTELFVTPKGVACLATNAMCGVDLRWPVVSTALSLPKVSVSGLPSGLKFTAKPVTAKVNGVTVTNVPANTIYGAPTAASSTDRATGLPKPSKVKVTVTTSGKSKAEYQLDLVVVALPDYAVGTFDGPVFAADGTTNGVVKLTVAKNGKISGTIQTNCVGAAAKKLSLSVASFAGYDLVTGVFALKPTYKDGKAAVEVPMTLADSAAVVGGKKVGVIDGESLFAYQNVLKGVAKADDFLAPDPMAKYPDLKLTVAKDGVLKVAGKVPDNSGKPISASASSQIYWDADEKGYRAVIYLPSKKGFDGVAEIIEVTENVSK